MSKKIWFKLLKYFLEYKAKILQLNLEIEKKSKSKIIRNPNFPSEISENLVRFCYAELFNIELEWKVGGDLWKKNHKYEVKAFVSGPISFSPNLDFEAIFFLDASNIIEGNFILYEVQCNSEVFKNLNVTSVSKFKDFEKKKRSRCLFDHLLKQWRKEKIAVNFYRVEVDIKKEKIIINKLFFPI